MYNFIEVLQMFCDSENFIFRSVLDDTRLGIDNGVLTFIYPNGEPNFVDEITLELLYSRWDDISNGEID